MADSTRRTFLGKAGLGAASLILARSARTYADNEDVVVGLIGCGGRGVGVGRQMGGVGYVCDPEKKRLGRAANAFKLKADHAATDLRRLLDADDLDAVIIATPDHWHGPAALLAIEAGKHVYVEKPATHNFRESQLLLAAARKQNRVVQHGTQSRSMDVVAGAIQMIREGVIGDVLMAKAWNIQRRRNIGHAKPSDPPAHLDYDLWVGPAEWMPFQKNRFHYDWHWWYNFGTGDMGNDGTHEIDYARWGLGVTAQPSKVSGLGTKLFFDDDQQFPDTMTITFEWPGDGTVGHKRHLIFEMRIWSPTRPYGIDNGAEFYGTEGKIVVTKRGQRMVFDRKNKQVEAEPKEPPKLLSHQADFVDAIRNERKPNADIAIGHRSVTLVHLGNICARVGRSLTFDPEKETTVGDDEAAALLHRRYRKDGHWAIPKGV
jgi:predicted dehydrogenase